MKNLLLSLLVAGMAIMQVHAQNPTGGPDSYGYTWRTGAAPAGPVYNWIDITTRPTAQQVSGLLDDNVVGPFALGSLFEFYGNWYNAFVIGSNGHITMGATLSGAVLAHPFQAFPSTFSADGLIAPMATDLYFDSTTTGEVWYWQSAAGDSLVVSWINVPFWSNLAPGFTGSNTFQLILDIPAGAITFQYAQQNGQSVQGNDFCSVGIESPDGTAGLNPLLNQYPLPGTAIRFSKGEYNLVRGSMFVDVNVNGSPDPGEPLLKNRIVTDVLSGFIGMSNTEGWYTVPANDSASYSLFPPSVMYYSAVPAQYNGFMNGPGLIDSLGSFIYEPDSIFNDLSLTLVAVPPFRPGFQVNYNMIVRNNGTATTTGSLTLRLPSGLSYVSSSLPAGTITADSIIMTLPPVDPFSSELIFASFTLSPLVPIGTVLSANASVWGFNDALPFDNYSEDTVIVGGSYDPNDIYVNQDEIDQSQVSNAPYLLYRVRFQNTGTDTAFNVSVINPVPDGVQPASFEWLGSTHTARVRISPDQQNFIFDFPDILLPDSNTNEPASNGALYYRLRIADNLQVGDSISSSAAIYFDFNAPVITNTAVTRIVTTSGLPDPLTRKSLTVYPNPAGSEVNVLIPEHSGEAILQLFRSDGAEVLRKRVAATDVTIPLSLAQEPEGLYVVRYTTGGKGYSCLLVKQPTKR